MLSRYVAWAYWTAVVMVSVFGTMAADVLHASLGGPYAVSAPAFLTALAANFALWYPSERTLSIHTIRTRRREGFYWAASSQPSPSAPPRAPDRHDRLRLPGLGRPLRHHHLRTRPGPPPRHPRARSPPSGPRTSSPAPW
ncbi:hypothetical protein [Streptomyces pseudovenezuelae]|uniref:Uncharacterized protein n=1 Tax=Streptomyces pseudovenezuelae TaxID=67350 RepID=A0ABT6LZK1_9ACTN|nr:hypothetical protein [Streptomyces pseudovenezuelae]